MNKSIQELLGKLKIVVVLILVVVMTGGLGGSTYVLASNVATQQASTGTASTIAVVGKAADTAVTTIAFPSGVPNTAISTPYNNVDTESSPQVLSGTVSEPVVRLKNSSAGVLNVTLSMTTWTNGVAASEAYELVASTTTNVAAVASVLSADGNTASVATAISINPSSRKALYLKLVLSSLASKTGTSTLTILGETP